MTVASGRVSLSLSVWSLWSAARQVSIFTSRSMADSSCQDRNQPWPPPGAMPWTPCNEFWDSWRMFCLGAPERRRIVEQTTTMGMANRTTILYSQVGMEHALAHPILTSCPRRLEVRRDLIETQIIFAMSSHVTTCLVVLFGVQEYTVQDRASMSELFSMCSACVVASARLR